MVHGCVLWGLIVGVLSIATFGFVGCIFILLCVILFAIGCSVAIYQFGRQRAKYLIEDFENLDLSKFQQPCLHSLYEKPLQRPPSARKFRETQSLTGSAAIDDQIDEILTLTLRDFVHSWYKGLSNDHDFLEALRVIAFKIIQNISKRVSHVDWVPFLTTHLVDDFASHIRLFRKSQEKIRNRQKRKNDKKVEDGDLEAAFFDFELEMEKNCCRDLVSTSPQYEKAYLRDLCDVLLYLLLPDDDFHSKPFRFLLREFFLNKVLLSCINQISEPDFVNHSIVWLLSEIQFGSEQFLTVIEDCRHVEELRSISECLNQEISAKRAHDVGGDNDFLIKQQLSSLCYVRHLVDVRLNRLQRGGNVAALRNDIDGSSTSIDKKMATGKQLQIPDLSLGFILNNHVALSYFIDFLIDLDGGQNLIYLFLAIEGFKVSAEQHLSAIHLSRAARAPNAAQIQAEHRDTVREAAMSVYEQYLSTHARNRVELDEQLLKKLLLRLRTEEPSESWFDAVQAKLFECLRENRFYPQFKKSSIYLKLLAELDLLKSNDSSSNSAQIDDICALDVDVDWSDYDSPSAATGKYYNGTPAQDDVDGADRFVEEDNSPRLNALISKIALTKEGKKAFAVYTIQVRRLTAKGELLGSWVIQRRYTDFHDLHIIIISKFRNLSGISFPGKRTFNNLDKDFLQKRRKALNAYLQTLLYPDVLKHNRGLDEVMFNFLTQSQYDEGRSLFRKLDSFNFINPFLSGVRTVTGTVLQMPDTFVDGVFRMGDGLGRMTRNMFGVINPKVQPQALLPHPQSVISSVSAAAPEGRVAAAVLDPMDPTAAAIENIPVRILLLLMDEVYDLRQRNQWFRRHLVAFLQQLIRATFGSSINRKIVDFVAWLTSEEQVVEYMRAFRKHFWPGGQLAENAPERPHNIQMRTRSVAKAKMLAALPDELRLFIGNDTTKTGTFMVFEAFQNEHLNRRFCYVLLEHFLRTVFPENRFEHLFVRLHSKSPRSMANQAQN